MMHLSAAQQIVSINNNCARTCRPLRNGVGQVQGVAKDNSKNGRGVEGERQQEGEGKQEEAEPLPLETIY